MVNDVVVMVNLHELERKNKERTRQACLRMDVRETQRTHGFIRRSLASITHWLRPSRQHAAQPADINTRVVSADAAERVTFGRASHERFRLHDI